MFLQSHTLLYHRWYLIPEEEHTVFMMGFDIGITAVSLVMVFYPPLTVFNAHGQEQQEQDAAFKAMSDKLMETLSHDVMRHNIYESVTARFNAFASDTSVQRYRVIRAGGCPVLTSFVAHHSQENHMKAQVDHNAWGSNDESLVIGCGDVIEVCDTKYLFRGN